MTLAGFLPVLSAGATGRPAGTAPDLGPVLLDSHSRIDLAGLASRLLPVVHPENSIWRTLRQDEPATVRKHPKARCPDADFLDTALDTDLEKQRDIPPVQPRTRRYGSLKEISIPALNLRAPILPVGAREIEYKNSTFQQWTAPDLFAAGWHNTSATLGKPGNTVLNGHHNAFDEVFRDLRSLENGDLIYLTSGEKVFTYEVGLTLLLNERFESVEHAWQTHNGSGPPMTNASP